MNKPVIAIDLDDTIGAFNQAFLEFHNQTFGTSVRYTDITDYNMCAIYEVDVETMVKRLFHFCHHHHHTIAPVAGAEEALTTLKEQCDLQIVTSRSESLRAVTEDWLATIFPGVFSAVHLSNSHGMEHSEQRRSKSAVCQDIGAMILIDEALLHAEEVAQTGVPVLLPDCPWNQGTLPSGVTRVRSWEEITKWIQTNVL